MQEIISPLDSFVIVLAGRPPSVPASAPTPTPAPPTTAAAAEILPDPSESTTPPPARRLLDAAPPSDDTQLPAEAYRRVFLRGGPGSARVTTGPNVDFTVLDFTRTGATFDILGGDGWGSVLIFDSVALWGHFASWETFWKDVASRYFIVHENASVCFINTCAANPSPLLAVCLVPEL